MAYVRKVKTASGATAVQIVEKRHGVRRIVAHVGSAHDDAGTWLAAGIAFAIGFTVRVIALYRGWEEPLAREPAGVYKHSDGRPYLDRKIAHKSQR